MPELLDRLQLAKAIGVHKNTIAAMVRDGRVPKPVNIGTDLAPNYRWSPKVINDWIDAGCPREVAQ